MTRRPEYARPPLTFGKHCSCRRPFVSGSLMAISPRRRESRRARFRKAGAPSQIALSINFNQLFQRLGYFHAEPMRAKQ